MHRDILIIGCGIFGAAIAWSLGRRGLGRRVLIVDRQPPASGATSRAAGLVTQVRADPVLQALAGETLAAIKLLKTGFSEDVGCHRVGALHIGPLAQQPALAQMLATCTAAGIRGQWLDQAQVLARSPWLAPAAFDVATYFPDECVVDPYLLSSAYLRGAQQMGVRLRVDTRVAHIRHLSGAVTGVALEDGTVLPARTVVNAAGAWSNLLSVPLSLPLPMAPVRSQYWITGRAPELNPGGPIVFMSDIRAYARPEVGALLFGVRESAPVVVSPQDLPENLQGFVYDMADPDGWDNLAQAFAPLCRYFPALERLGIAHYITGPSNYTPDGQPIVGASDSISGLLVASGCNGSGITYSAGVGRLIAELICGDTPFVDARRLDPARALQIDPFDPAFLQACAHARATKSTG
ncbi:FAD-dependent oxidoreductase [Actimicrobium antarcticum]|uniref:FAD dependent oxidoreductase domain-containing protein n=1 Tax=Actimicrobium antarcticum TaxID=1051899 RepID=A0ABP7TV52_9BURK